MKVDTHVTAVGLEVHRHALRAATVCLPAIQPDAIGRSTCSGQIVAVAAEPLCRVEFLRAKIAHGEMSEIDIACRPMGCALHRLGCEATPEKGQLEAESVTIRSLQVAGVVPPLSLIRWMCAVVGGETEGAWSSDPLPTRIGIAGCRRNGAQLSCDWCSCGTAAIPDPDPRAEHKHHHCRYPSPHRYPVL